MLDLGTFGEILIIAVAVLILVGPKELPSLLRTLGRWIGKIRRTSWALRRYIDDYIQEGEFEDYQEHARKEALKDPKSSTQRHAHGSPKKKRNL